MQSQQRRPPIISIKYLFFVSGRNPDTDSLNLESVGVKTDEKTKKIIGNHDHDRERSSVPNIYAIGDVLHVS